MIRLPVIMTLGLAVFGLCSTAEAQFRDPPGRHFPLDQQMAPGEVSRWQAMGGRILPNMIQPVQVITPQPAKITFFNRSLAAPVTQPMPSQIGLAVGRSYRFVISDLPEHPGVKLYPTVELIGHLHPPPGQNHRFPIPLAFTQAELEAAMEGQLVTKVVYLEQPELATPVENELGRLTFPQPGDTNLLAAADVRGRPMAILRLGGRTPSRHGPDPAFFGPLWPVFASPIRRPQPTEAQPKPAVVEPVSAP